MTDRALSPRYLDISTALVEGVVVYPGDPSFEIQRYVDIPQSGFRASALRIGTHCGTHVDAPSHVVSDGPSVDALEFEVLCGRAWVLDFRHIQGAIDLDSMRRACREQQGCERILLKTSSGPLVGQEMNQAYVHLSLEAAIFLRNETQVKLVGIDYLSVEGMSSEVLAVHRALLLGEKPIVILEGLDLREAEAGQYELLCLPLRIPGADGAPARAVLRRY